MQKFEVFSEFLPDEAKAGAFQSVARACGE
jgi:hypothetical protein